MKKVLKFYSETCAPCRVMSKTLKELKNAKVQDVDVTDESNSDLLDKWKIIAVPTVVVLSEDDTLLAEFRGVTPIEKIQEVVDGGQTTAS